MLPSRASQLTESLPLVSLLSGFRPSGEGRKGEQAAQPSFHRNLEFTGAANKGLSTNRILAISVVAEWVPSFRGRTERREAVGLLVLGYYCFPVRGRVKNPRLRVVLVAFHLLLLTSVRDSWILAKARMTAGDSKPL